MNSKHVLDLIIPLYRGSISIIEIGDTVELIGFVYLDLFTDSTTSSNYALLCGPNRIPSTRLFINLLGSTFRMQCNIHGLDFVTIMCKNRIKKLRN